MTEANAGGVSTPNTTSNATVDPKSSASESSVDQSAKIAEYEGKLRDAQEVAKRFKAIQEAYNKNENVKKAIDSHFDPGAAKQQIKDIKEEIKDNEGDEDYTAKLERKLSDIEAKLSKFQDIYAVDKIGGSRASIDNQYRAMTVEMARASGIDHDSVQFKNLYRTVIDNAKALCPEFGLVDDNGAPDPLLNYNVDLLKKAFNNSMKELQDGFGFDPQTAKVNQQRRRDEMQKEALNAEEKKIREKYDMKNPRQAAQYTKELFFHRLAKKGLTREDALREIGASRLI